MAVHRLPVARQDVNLALVLKCGQSFRWRVSGPNEWCLSKVSFRSNIQVLRHAQSHNNASSGLYNPVLMVIMVAEGIYHRTLPDTRNDDQSHETRQLLQSYLSLDVSLPELYAHWSGVDSHFKSTALRFAGVRILRQDPWECLVGFICSSNNNIARITQMVLLPLILLIVDGKALCSLWEEVGDSIR